MMLLMGILITILVLGFVIFFHELGHLWAAKRMGVGVYEFSVGMGPKLFSKRFGETDYCLRAFPFGGFVKLAGLDDESDIPDELNYRKKSVLARMLVISAGSLMNLLLGFLIFVFSFMFFGVPSSTAALDSLSPGSPAYEIGLLQDDVILSISGHDIRGSGKRLVRYIQESKGESLVFLVRRGDQDFTCSIKPEKLKDRYIIGVNLKTESVFFNPVMSVAQGATMTAYHVRMVFKSLSMLLSGTATMKDLTGPIGIVQFASFQLKDSVAGFLSVISMISISLGVFNMLPFPVLDGGHFVFLLVEAIRGKAHSEKVEVFVGNLGAFVLILLMVFVVFNDIQLWQQRSAFMLTLFR
jgi:regulator of sigma E protease